MAYIADPSNPGWLRDENADAALESSWVKIPDGYVADPNSPGWWYDPQGDPAQQSTWWHDPSIQDAPAQPTGILRAVDVASYQSADLTGYIQRYSLDMVVVRLYQRTIEGPALQAKSRAQIASGKAAGVILSVPYLWLYSGATAPADRQIGEALDLAASCGLGVRALALDVEPYTDGSLPKAGQIGAALDVCTAQGVTPLIYSGKWVFDQLGNPSFPGVAAWWASYDGVAALDVAVPGGMVLVGKQYADRSPTGESLDMDIFDAAFVG